MSLSDLARLRLRSIRRKSLSVEREDLVTIAELEGGRSLPMMVRPRTEGMDAASWVAGNERLVASLFYRSGAVLFRGFPLGCAESFEAFIRSVSGEPLAYRERSTPRSPIAGRIYSSTEYPASQSIFLHNENSYQAVFPLKLFFYCAQPALAGGETPLADTRRVYQRIPPVIRETFAERKVKYVRNLSGEVGLPWQEVFQTEDRSEVSAYCARRGIVAEWKPCGGLRMSSVLEAIAVHPVTGERSWFNHAAFFHVSTLAPDLRKAIENAFDYEDYPSNTYYGDGAPIEASVLDELRAAYLAEKVVFPWEQGDLLMLDNVLTAHAREPYEGPRRIWTGMAEPFTRRGASIVPEGENGAE